MNLVSIPLFIQKNWLVVESDLPFWIAFNAKAPDAIKDGKIMADDFIKSRGGSRYFSCMDLLSTSMKFCGYNVWLVYDADLVTGNISAPSYYTCYTKPDTLQGLDGQIVEIGGVQGVLDVHDSEMQSVIAKESTLQTLAKESTLQELLSKLRMVEVNGEVGDYYTLDAFDFVYNDENLIQRTLTCPRYGLLRITQFNYGKQTLYVNKTNGIYSGYHVPQLAQNIPCLKIS